MTAPHGYIPPAWDGETCRPDGFATRRLAARRAWLIAETKRVEPYQCDECQLWHLAAVEKTAQTETQETR